MVLESVAEMVLSRLLDKIFYGITRQNIQVALLEGKFVLSNIGLQPSLLSQLNLPIELKYSYVQRLEIHIPWREEEVSLTINISNIYLLAATADYSLDLYEIFIRRKEQVIEAALKEFRAGLQQKSKKEGGFIEKLLLNLLDNVNIKIQCIHLRCENRLRNYSFGVKINEVSARTVGADDQPCFFNREKTPQEYIRYVVEMDFMGIYFNSKEQYFLGHRSLAEITDQFHRLSHRAFRNYLQGEDEAGQTFHYILTVSLKTILKKYIYALERLKQKGEGVAEEAKRQESRQASGKAEGKGQLGEGKYLFECNINLGRVESRLSDEQYYDLLDLVSLISDYQRSYTQFAQRWHLQPLRERTAKDISELLLRKKKLAVVGRREKETLNRHCRNYMGWLFKTAWEEVRRRNFICQALRNEVTLANLKENPKTFSILRKTDNEKLKLWVLLALYYRKKYEDQVGVLFRGSRDRQDKFIQEHIKRVPMFQELELEQEVLRQREVSGNKYQIFLKLILNIQEFNFQISRENNLGVFFGVQKLRVQLTLRQKNYLIHLQMQDLQANVFHCRRHYRIKTYVPIISRNCILDRTANLLELTYERNPPNKPFVFTQIDARFESIEITIYPEAFKQFYEILLGEGQSKRRPSKKKEGGQNEGREGQEGRSTVRQIGFQKTIIRAKVRTPWIVLPLSAVNDPAQECWVARLGDFSVDTPQYDCAQIRSQEQIFYEQYRLELKRFQLSYFSSINLFHNWLRFNCSLDNLLKIKAFSNQKILTMVRPFSCFVQLALLKSALSSAIRQRKPKATAKIMIDQVSIRVSKFLMGRLKSRIDDVLEEGGEVEEFMESNINNIRQENSLAGYCKVSYQGITRMNFYCVLRGNYMYFFINETFPKYHFCVSLPNAAIRLVSNQVENLNPHLPKLLTLYLGDPAKHHHWRKQILHILNRQARRVDTASATSFRSLRRERQAIHESMREEGEPHSSSSSLKMTATFLMNKLSIQLFDEQEALFMDCNFKKATLQYSTVGERELKFSLNEWTVCQGDGSLFISSNCFFKEGDEGSGTLNNFLEVCCGFNSITEQLREINVKVDKLFLAWKVQLFSRILLFFFYNQQAADAPAPPSLNKKLLQINISIQRFNFYCYFASELLALTKLQFINILYRQSDIEESYEVACKVFQMDKYVEGKLEQRLPMIRRRYLSAQGDDQEPLFNNFNLKYILRKSDTKGYPNITRLERHLERHDLLVSQIECDWKDTEIYFENQLTLRVLNYVLNKVLGTVAAKFKKRDYSPNYIFESLKITKLSVFDIVLNNCLLRVPPHTRGQREFAVDIQRIRITKNIDDAFMPSEVKVMTISDPARFFWESMVIQVKQASLSYQVGSEPPVPVLAAPLNMSIVYAKLNFQREYFVILKHHDDVDRRATLDLVIEDSLTVEVHKIMFVTFLQVFYQNIKHKDGLGDVFEPPLPFPSLRQYDIYLNRTALNLHHFDEKTGALTPFSKLGLERMKVNYKQVGQESTIKIEGEGLWGQGELPLWNLDPRRQKMLVEMKSRDGEMKLVVTVEQYALSADLDKINNIVEFINYDNDYVANQLMPKKRSSWQYVNVFAKHCQLRLGALRVEGEFYVTYLKGMRNHPETPALQYLLTEEAAGAVKKDAGKLDWDDLTDKEIKVNGEDLRLSINGDSIGEVSSFCFHRTDLTCKSTNRRHKCESIQVGEGSLHIQPVDLLTIWEVYNSNIRKKPNFVLMTFYEPWDQLPAKVKVVQKRNTEVEIQCISISVLPTRVPDFPRYLRIELELPSILYKTYLDEQEVQVSVVFRLWHHQQRMREVQVGECKSLRIRYLNFKQKKEKIIDILHGKGILINPADFNNKLIHYLIQQLKVLKDTTRNNLHVNLLGAPLHYKVVLRNQSGKGVKINVGGRWMVSAMPLQEEGVMANLEQYLGMLNDPRCFVEIQEEGNRIIRKMSFDISLYSPTPITELHCLFIEHTQQHCCFVYRPLYTLRNLSSCTIYLKDKRTVRKGESVSLYPSKSYIEFEMSHAGWSKEYRVAVGKEEIFGEGSFGTCYRKDEGQVVVQLFDRFVIKNMLPCPIFLQDNQILPLHEHSLGYLSKSQKASFPVRVGQNNIQIDLTDSSGKVTAFTKVNKRDQHQGNEQKIQYEVRWELYDDKKIIHVNVYTEFALRNLNSEPLHVCHKSRNYIIGGQETLLLPSAFSSATYFEGEKELDVTYNKNRQFFSKSLKFTQTNRLDKKAIILKVEAKHNVRNNTNEIIEIQICRDSYPIPPQQTYFLSPAAVQQQEIKLIFGRFCKKSFELGKKGINFLEIEEQFYKVSLLEKEESILLIEDSPSAHKIINKLDSISVIAHSTLSTSHPPHNNLVYSTYEINQQETSIQKLIKPQSEAEMGVFCWNSPQLELQFYLQGKNIQFKQKFTVDFQKLDHKFSYKHMLHDEKDKRNVFFLVITIQKDKEHRFTITIYRQKDYEALPVDKMKFTIQQISISFAISPQYADILTFECFKACFSRQKGIQLSDFDIQVQKLLVREGKNVSILGALGNSRFLDCHLILSKTAWGIAINTLMLKLAPFEIICRERIIFKILEKIVEVRAQNPKKTNRELTDFLQTDHHLKSKGSRLGEETSIMRHEETKLQKQWEEAKKELIKQWSILIINNLQLSETSLFVSYSKEEYKQFDEKIASDQIIKYMLLMPSISELKISIPHLKINQFVGEPKQFAKEMLSRLKQSIGSTIANSFSALPFFDNPVIVIDGIFKYIEGMVSIQ